MPPVCVAMSPLAPKNCASELLYCIQWQVSASPAHCHSDSCSSVPGPLSIHYITLPACGGGLWPRWSVEGRGPNLLLLCEWDAEDLPRLPLERCRPLSRPTSQRDERASSSHRPAATTSGAHTTLTENKPPLSLPRRQLSLTPHLLTSSRQKGKSPRSTDTRPAQPVITHDTRWGRSWSRRRADEVPSPRFGGLGGGPRFGTPPPACEQGLRSCSMPRWQGPFGPPCGCGGCPSDDPAWYIVQRAPCHPTIHSLALVGSQLLLPRCSRGFFPRPDSPARSRAGAASHVHSADVTRDGGPATRRRRRRPVPVPVPGEGGGARRRPPPPQGQQGGSEGRPQARGLVVRD